MLELIPCVGRRKLALSKDNGQVKIDILWREENRRLATLVLEPKDAAALRTTLTRLLKKVKA